MKIFSIDMTKTSRMKKNILLGLALVMLVPASEAFAQAAGNVGKPTPAQNSPSAVNNEGSYENQQRYFDNNQLAKKYRDSVGRKDVQGTKNKEAGDKTEVEYDPTIDTVTGTGTDSTGATYYTYRKQTMPTVTPVEAADKEAITGGPKLTNTLVTDSGAQAALRHDALRSTEMQFDPERLNHTVTGSAGMAAAGASNSSAGVAEQSFDVALQRIVYAEGNGALINVANEASGTGGNHGALFRTIPDAVGMVQKMYKNVFVPMAILFLLPGAVISQVKGLVGRGLGNTVSVPESQHPFDGILRSIVAIFLIPGTQVFMSWSIDTGNSMAWSVRDWVEIPRIEAWAHQLSYNPQTFDNVIKMPAPKPDYAAAGGGGGGGGGGGTFQQFGSQYFGAIGGIIGGLLDMAFGGINAPGEGTVANMSETKTHFERQGYLDIIFQLAFNYMMYIAAFFIIILSAYQVAMMCYLFLMGPLSAAFYAWPQVNQGNNVPLFRGVFGNWLEAVIKVSMWRFFWMVVLAVVTQRLIYTGGGTSDLQWEVCMFASFLGIMLYVPQQPFNFAPAGAYGETASVYQAAMQQAQQQAGSSGGGKGGGAGGGAPQQAAAPGGAAQGKESEHGHDSGTKVASSSPDQQGGDSHTGSGDKSLSPTAPSTAPQAQGQDKSKDTAPVAPPPTAQPTNATAPHTGAPDGHSGNNGGQNGNAGAPPTSPASAPAAPAAAPAAAAPASAPATGTLNASGSANATANGIAANAGKGGPPVGLSPSSNAAAPASPAGNSTQVVQAPPSASPSPSPQAPAAPAPAAAPPTIQVAGGGGAASASADIGNKTKDDLNGKA
jgi:hypothetical protein